MDDRSQAREEEDVGSGDGRGLPRNTAELRETTEPLPADVPGGGGRLFDSLTLEQRRLIGRPNPATTTDLIKDFLALRLEPNKATRDWIDGLSEDDRTAAQCAVAGELVAEGRQTFTTWGANFEFMDKPTSFGTFSDSPVSSD